MATTTQNKLLVETCPKCQGWAVLRSKEGQAMCGVCLGAGQTIALGKNKIGFNLPAIIPYGYYRLKRLTETARNFFFIVIFLFTIYFGNELVGLPLDAQASIWQNFIAPSYLGSLFWFSVLVDLWGIYLFSSRQTPTKSLNQLDQEKQETFASNLVDGLSFFSEETKKFIVSAIEQAEKQNKTILTREILFQTLFFQPKVQLMFVRLQLPVEKLARALAPLLNQREPEPVISGFIVVSPAVREVLLQSLEQAVSLNFDYVDIEDVFLAFLAGPGKFKNVFEDLDLTYDKVKAVAMWVNEEQELIRAWRFWRKKGRRSPKGNINRAWTSLPTPFLDRYSQDLTKLAGLGALSQVKVRDSQIKEILTVLSRTEKNNALLIGEPGVGKSSIVGAIAQRVLVEDVPEPLKDKRLVSLDLGALASGHGSAEENLQRVISEVENAGNIILYLGHVEALVGTSTGAFDAAAILADALARGHFQVIAAATSADRHRYIESNPTLASLFQMIDIPEVSEEEAVRILEEEAPKIENRQRVLLTYPALLAAVELSARLIQDKKLPDKAIEIADQAATLAAEEKAKMVTREFILKVMKSRTNVPIENVTESEGAKLLNLENILRQRVIGQDQAVHVITEALKRARVGLKDEKRPIGSFLFVGPTGVGKTETAKALAASYFGSESAMIRFDMSEYQEPEAIYRLIGPPPKSDKFVEGGSLTTPIREKPYCLILLDEFEKAHPDVLTLFLQVLDDGRLTENTGRTVSFANTIIIATSNAGTDQVSKMLKAGKNLALIQENLLDILQDFFRPELINRFDAVVVFRPMDQEMLVQIAKNLIAKVAAALEAQHGISLKVPEETIDYLAQKGFDPVFGARPLRRVIQDKFESLIANLILANKIKKGDLLVITQEMIK